MQHFLCSNGSLLRYDSVRDLTWLSFPPRPPAQQYFLENAADIAQHFDDLARQLRAIGRPQAYIVIDYANFDVNPDCNAAYLEGLAKVRPLTGGALRHSCSILQASMLRANNVPAPHGLPQMCSNQDEALRLAQDLCRVSAVAKAV